MNTDKYFKVGDSVTEPLWGRYNWKIEKIFLSKYGSGKSDNHGKMRALLKAVFGYYEEREPFVGIVKKEKVVYCSEWVCNLIHKSQS